MDTTTLGSVDKAYTAMVSVGGAKSVGNLIQLLKQQITLVEQSTLEDSEKESRIALLEARIAGLEQRLELIQARETSSSSATEGTSAIQDNLESISSDTDSINVIYQPEGTTSYADSGSSRLIAYA